MKKKNLVVLLFIFSAAKVWTIENHFSVAFLASTAMEVQASAYQQLLFPKNVRVGIQEDLSPTHFLLSVMPAWTPAPWLNLHALAQAGTGWNYDSFGRRQVGLGLRENDPSVIPAEHAAGPGADGLYWTAFLGATLQFDAAAIWPGPWHHIVARLVNRVGYQQYTKAHGSDIWYFLGNARLNQNSFVYTFRALAGYQMPIFLNLIALQLDIYQPIYNPQSGQSVTAYGPELVITPTVQMTFPKGFSLNLLAQFANRPVSPLKPNHSRYWTFYRAAFVLTYRIW
jgi:hypothetical protein